jgi:hypothetical protein
VPAAALWRINARIALVMPAHRDLWWEVDENTDVAKLGDEVAEALKNYAVPWLESLATRKELIDAFEHRHPLGIGAMTFQLSETASVSTVTVDPDWPGRFVVSRRLNHPR